MATTNMFHVALLAACLASCSAIIGNGPCPKVQTQKNFDISKYLGTWYEIRMIPTVYQPSDAQCTQAKYSLRDDGMVRVENGFYTPAGEFQQMTGEAQCPNAKEPAKCEVRFFEDQPFGPYWVVETDYTSYTLIWSCTNLFGLTHSQSSWILSRDHSLDSKTLERLEKLGASYGIRVDAYVSTPQDSCPNYIPIGY